MNEFNSDEYAWKDLQVVMGGRLVTGIQYAKWKLSRTVNHIYAAGVEPHSRTKGNKEYTGEIRLLQSEIEAMNEAAFAVGKEDLSDLTWQIDIAFVPDSLTDGTIRRRRLINVDFEEYEEGMEQNDSSMEVTLPCKIGKITRR